MKRKIILVTSLILISSLSLFVYNRYKTKRLERFIGVEKHKVEEFIDIQKHGVSIEKISFEEIDNRVLEIIKTKKLKTTQPILRYTKTGEIFIIIFWLIDEGDGYYVIEAISTTK